MQWWQNENQIITWMTEYDEDMFVKRMTDQAGYVVERQGVNLCIWDAEIAIVLSPFLNPDMNAKLAFGEMLSSRFAYFWRKSMNPDMSEKHREIEQQKIETKRQARLKRKQEGHVKEFVGKDFDEVKDNFVNVKEVEPLGFSNSHTKVFVVDEPGPGNACHEYFIVDEHTWTVLEYIEYQRGPIGENGVNGIQGVDLLAIERHRYQGFQAGEYACRENDLTLQHIELATMWQDVRTTGRERRNVEGTSKK